MTYAATADWLRGRLWFGYVIGGVAWVVWLGNLALGGWYRDYEGILLGADHLAFYSAARAIYDGRPAAMYDLTTLHAYQQSLIGWDWWGLEVYRNPPFYALLYLPTAGLSYYHSYLVWTAIGLALLVASVFLLGPERPGRVLGWAVAFYPVFAVVSFGQNSFLSLTVFAAVYRLLDRGRPFAAGLLAGLLWFKPPLLIGLFVWWAFSPRRHLDCWLGVCVTGLSLAAVSWLVLPDASWAFVETLRDNVGFGGERMWNKHTPKAFFEMLLPGRPHVYWPLTLALVAVSIAVAYRLERRTAGALPVLYPVAVFLSLWASPHALIYEWAIALAAAVVIWERFPARRDVWLCWFALAWVALAVSTVVAKVQIDLELPFTIQVSIPALGVVGWRITQELTRSVNGPAPTTNTADDPAAASQTAYEPAAASQTADDLAYVTNPANQNVTNPVNQSALAAPTANDPAEERNRDVTNAPNGSRMVPDDPAGPRTPDRRGDGT